MASERDDPMAQTAAAPAAGGAPTGGGGKSHDPQSVPAGASVADRPPPRARRRRWLKISAVTALVLALAVVLAPSLIPTAALKSMAAGRIAAATGQACTIESLSFGWLSGVRLAGLTLGRDGDALRVRLASASADASLLPLLAKKVAGLDIQATDLHVVYQDAAAGMRFDWTLPRLSVKAADLESEASFSAVAYPAGAEGTETVAVEGTASLVKNLEYDPQGAAKAVLRINALDLALAARQAGQGELLAGGAMGGEVAFDFSDGRLRAAPRRLRAERLLLPAGEPGAPPTGLPVLMLDGGQVNYEPATGMVVPENVELHFGGAVSARANGSLNLNETNGPGLPTGGVVFACNANLAAATAEWAGTGLLPALPTEISGNIAWQINVDMPRAAADPARPLTVEIGSGVGEVVARGGDLPGAARLDVAPLRLRAALGPALASLQAAMPLKGVALRFTPTGSRGICIVALDGQAEVAGPFAALVAVVRPAATQVMTQNLQDDLPGLQAVFQPETEIVYEVATERLSLRNASLALYHYGEQTPAARLTAPALAAGFAPRLNLATPDGQPARLEGDLTRIVQFLPIRLRGELGPTGTLEFLAGLRTLEDGSLQLTLDPRSGLKGFVFREGDVTENLGDITFGGVFGYDENAGQVTAGRVSVASAPLSAGLEGRYNFKTDEAEAAYSLQATPARAKALLSWLGAARVAEALESAQAAGQAAYGNGQVSLRSAQVQGRVKPPDLPAQDFVLNHNLDFRWGAENRLVIQPGAPVRMAIGGGQILDFALQPGEIAFAGDFSSWSGALRATGSGRLESANTYLLPLLETVPGGRPLARAMENYDLSAAFQMNAALTPETAQLTLSVLDVRARGRQSPNPFLALRVAKPSTWNIPLPGGAPSGSLELAFSADAAASWTWASTLAAAAPAAWLGGEEGWKNLNDMFASRAAAGVLASSILLQASGAGQGFAVSAELTQGSLSARGADGQWERMFGDPKVSAQLAGVFAPDNGGLLRLTTGQLSLSEGAGSTAQLATADKPLEVVLNPFMVRNAEIAFNADLAALAKAAPAYWPADLAVAGALRGGVRLQGGLNPSGAASNAAGGAPMQTFGAAAEITRPAAQTHDGRRWTPLYQGDRLILQLAGLYDPAQGELLQLTAGQLLAGEDPRQPRASLILAKQDNPLVVRLSPPAVRAARVEFGVADLAALQKTIPGILPPPAALGGGLAGGFDISGPLTALALRNGVVNFSNASYRLDPAAGDLLATLPAGSKMSLEALFNLAPPPFSSPAAAGIYQSLAAFDMPSATLTLDRAEIAMGGQRRLVRDFRLPLSLQRGVLMTGDIVARAEPAAPNAPAPEVDLVASVDFMQAQPCARINLKKAHNLPIPDLAGGFLPSWGRVTGGVLHLPPPAAPQPVTIEFSGLDTDSIAKTVKISNTAFRAENLAARLQARGDGNGDGLLGMLGLSDIPASMDKVFGIKDGVYDLSIKSVSGAFNADGAGNFNTIQEFYVEGDSISDFAAKGTMKAAPVIADSAIDFRVYITRNLNKLIDLPALVNDSMAAQGAEHIGGADRQTVLAAMGESMEKAVQERRIDMSVKGTLGRPEVTKGVALFVRDLVTASLGGIATAVARDKATRVLEDKLGDKLGDSKLAEGLSNLLGGRARTETPAPPGTAAPSPAPPAPGADGDGGNSSDNRRRPNLLDLLGRDRK